MADVNCFSFYFSWQRPYQIDFKEAECFKIDASKKILHCKSAQVTNLGGKEEEFTIDYDILIIAVGAQVNTFNTPGVSEYAHFLKVHHILV